MEGTVAVTAAKRTFPWFTPSSREAVRISALFVQPSSRYLSVCASFDATFVSTLDFTLPWREEREGVREVRGGIMRGKDQEKGKMRWEKDGGGGRKEIRRSTLVEMR